ncbi:MAG: hypothetical protein M0R17_02910 [Candidatus Omnitrophica bacterium]|jgi:hypothetical protein|nr:hypothetical protein [Candidatus Omnitrophota bacterium]
MKTRHGFVSNSSSSSFILGIPSNIPKEQENLIKIYTDLCQIYNKDKKESIFINQNDKIKEIKNKIKEYKKVIKKDENLLNKYNELLKIPNINEILLMVENTKNSKLDYDYIIHDVEHDEIKYLFTSIKNNIDYNNNIINELQKELDTLKNIKEDKLVYITVDQHWKTPIEECIIYLAENNVISIISRNDT